MTVGQRATASVTLTASGSQEVTVSNFTTTDGTSLTSTDAVVVTGYIHENDATFNRIGDPDADSTFEINIQIEARTGGGERSDVSHIVTDVAGIEVSETSGSGQNVTLYGYRVSASKVFVVQSAGVADTNEISRTTGARGQEETIYELAVSGSTNIIRRHDPDDDGTFEVSSTVDTISSLQRDQWLPMKDETGRTNPEFETALQASGGSRDLLMTGSIGQEGL